MEAIFILIPISLGIVFVALTVFIWAVNNYQFDDLDKEATRILEDFDESTIEPTQTELKQGAQEA